MRRTWILLGLLLAAPLHARAAGQSITVGGLTLTKCITVYDGYCGSLTRPLDPAGHVPGALTVGFEFYPHSEAGPAVGTIIAQEGGPGFSTTGSRDGYVRLFTPLRTTRDIVLIDKRGTGRSSVIKCPWLQHHDSALAIAACGARLGKTAWLYSSAYAADDVAAVLAALGTGKVDYYGDSYGTFFGQVLAVRHPDLLRTITLDSAYPVIGETAFDPSEPDHGVPAFEKACQRSPSCAALGGSATARFDALLASLRAHPVTGMAPGPTGVMQPVTANAGALFAVVALAGNSPTAYRDIDAAGRALLGQGDAVPLLRLVAEATGDSAGYSPAKSFSNGEAEAVTCADYPLLFDMRAPPAARQAEYAKHLAAARANNPGLYAPFTLDEALHATSNPLALNACIPWPAAPGWAAPGHPVAADARFPNVPVLVLSGELDTVTSPKEGRWTTALFPNAYFVVVHNTTHETAVGDEGYWVPPYGADLARCAGPIVLAFVASGGDPGDTSCALRVRPIRTVPAFASSWQNVAPAAALAGNAADASGLTLASAVAETVGDVIARYYVTTSNFGGGLRGGGFTLHGTRRGYDFALNGLRWTQDLSVSGTITWDQIDDHVLATVSFAAPGHSGTLTIHWHDRARDAPALLQGEVDAQALVATRLAP